jgi:hypothetical protein
VTGDILAEPATTSPRPAAPPQARLDMLGRLTMPVKALSSTL